MVKIKNPILSLGARGLVGAISYLKRRKTNIAEIKPEIPDQKTTAQLSWRHMYQKAVALWNALSAAEKQDWESQARPKHMTGFAWFMSQALKPNPGLYLPLQGGTMAGDIDMAKHKIEKLPAPIDGQDADTKTARDAAIAAAIGGSLTCDIYGYDGSNWQKLLVESAAQHNLRVKLYDGANDIDTDLGNATLGETQRGLHTRAYIYGRAANVWYRVDANSIYYDGLSSTLIGLYTAGFLHGYNGATWDRLRTFGTGVLKVAKGDISPSRIRMTATGRVGVAGAKKLFWVACSPDAVNAEWEITDADAGGGAVVYDHFDQDKSSEQIDFNPPLEFATGIWVEKFDHMKSLVFCYK